MLESALEAGFSAAGIDIGLWGPCQHLRLLTLTKHFVLKRVLLSVHHINPFYDNGIKFFSTTA